MWKGQKLFQNKHLIFEPCGSQFRKNVDLQILWVNLLPNATSCKCLEIDGIGKYNYLPVSGNKYCMYAKTNRLKFTVGFQIYSE